MLVLGLETSCDETSVAVFDTSRGLLSVVTSSSVSFHAPYGGIVPEAASRFQLEYIVPCYKKALKEAQVDPSELECIAVTKRPGLIGSLLVGLNFAKGLSCALSIPVVEVDHLIAHAHASFLEYKELEYPFLALVVSGGHTCLMSINGPHGHEILGRTLDDAVGEAFDKVARHIGLGYPGGPFIEKEAQRARPGQERGFSLPRVFLDNSLDFSLSGLKTAATRIYHRFDETSAGEDKEQLVADLAAELQDAIVEVLVANTIRAAKTTGLSQVVIGGGVAANNKLRSMISEEARKEGIDLYIPSARFCGDNAAMIAVCGVKMMEATNVKHEH